MNAWNMVRTCWLAQWRGFSPEEQAYMEGESERGRPAFIALGHQEYVLWEVEHRPGNARFLSVTVAQLLSIKVDHYPNEWPPFS